jgi:hypothetical protein
MNMSNNAHSGMPTSIMTDSINDPTSSACTQKGELNSPDNSICLLLTRSPSARGTPPLIVEFAEILIPEREGDFGNSEVPTRSH